MRPAAEALAQTIDVMLDRRGQAGDERLALELESRIIVSHFYLLFGTVSTTFRSCHHFRRILHDHLHHLSGVCS